ncbi:MAG: DUF6514 family protein [Oscillospiraceae bacterium]|nr:DUF6514 family protein [Oscillospiraceae bacterium]
MKRRQKLRYVCTAQWIQEDGRKSYRLDVLSGGLKPRVLCAVSDVCADEARARQLEALLCRNQVSPKHILDVLEDWLP